MRRSGKKRNLTVALTVMLFLFVLTAVGSGVLFLSKTGSHEDQINESTEKAPESVEEIHVLPVINETEAGQQRKAYSPENEGLRDKSADIEAEEPDDSISGRKPGRKLRRISLMILQRTS